MRTWFRTAVIFIALTGLAGAEPASKSPWLAGLEKSFDEHKEFPRELAAGKITAFYLSAQWCGPCRQFTPILNAFRDRHGDQFQIVFVSLDTDDESMVDYWKHAGFKSPVLKIAHLPKELAAQRKPGIPQVIICADDGTVLTSQGREVIACPESDGEFQIVRQQSASHASAKTWQKLVADQSQLIAKARSDAKEEYDRRNRAMVAAAEKKHGAKPIWSVVSRHLALEPDRYLELRADTQAAIDAMSEYGTQVGKDFSKRSGELDDLKTLFSEDLFAARLDFGEWSERSHPLLRPAEHCVFMAGRNADDLAAAREFFQKWIASGGGTNQRLGVVGLAGVASAGDPVARDWVRGEAGKKIAQMNDWVIHGLAFAAAQEDALGIELLAKMGPEIPEHRQFFYGIALARPAAKGNTAAVDAFLAHLDRWPDEDRRIVVKQAAAAGNEAAKTWLAKHPSP